MFYFIYLDPPLGRFVLHVGLDSQGPFVGNHLLVNRDNLLHLGVLLETLVQAGEQLTHLRIMRLCITDRCIIERLIETNGQKNERNTGQIEESEKIITKPTKTETDNTWTDRNREKCRHEYSRERDRYRNA